MILVMPGESELLNELDLIEFALNLLAESTMTLLPYMDEHSLPSPDRPFLPL